eukprot:366407-Chlamydomonas_euryale.AAC.2
MRRCAGIASSLNYRSFRRRRWPPVAACHGAKLAKRVKPSRPPLRRCLEKSRGRNEPHRGSRHGTPGIG